MDGVDVAQQFSRHAGDRGSALRVLFFWMALFEARANMCQELPLFHKVVSPESVGLDFSGFNFLIYRDPADAQELGNLDG